MDSGSANAANDTDKGGHLECEESSEWCEHAVIALSVFMVFNMLILMFCNRMLVLGKIHKLLGRERQVMVAAVCGVPVQRSRSMHKRRPSTDSVYYPSTGVHTPTIPTTDVINNGSELVKKPRATTPILGGKRVVLMQNPVFSMENDTSESDIDLIIDRATKSIDRNRKTSVFMDRPLPALPEQDNERRVDDGLECGESTAAGRNVTKTTTKSLISYQATDEKDSRITSEIKLSLPVEADCKPGGYIDIELFV